MTKKHTLVHVQNYFKEQGCELLETEYKNANTKMKYLCNCGNKSTMTFANFQKGKRCRKCSGYEKHTFEDVQKYFKEQDCELLSTEYIDNRTKMKYICSCKNISETTFGHFKKGVRCRKCSGYEKHTFEDVQKYFKEQECELLSIEYINCDTKLNYICNCGNKSEISYDSFRRGSRCNICKNKTEKIVSEFIESKYTNIIFQPKFEWCKNKTFLPFDFLLDNEKVIIEVDGIQHFKQVSNWKSPEETQKGDLFKMKCAFEHGYSIIRIFQEDIFNNTIDWKVLIEEAINSKEKVQYISKDINLYDNYKNYFI